MKKEMVILVLVMIGLVLLMTNFASAMSYGNYYTSNSRTYYAYYQPVHTYTYYSSGYSHRYRIYFVNEPVQIYQSHYMISYSSEPRSYHYQNMTYAEYYGGISSSSQVQTYEAY